MRFKGPFVNGRRVSLIERVIKYPFTLYLHYPVCICYNKRRITTLFLFEATASFIIIIIIIRWNLPFSCFDGIDDAVNSSTQIPDPFSDAVRTRGWHFVFFLLFSSIHSQQRVSS